MNNDWTTFLFKTFHKQFKGKNKKIKTWPIYREHAGM